MVGSVPDLGLASGAHPLLGLLWVLEQDSTSDALWGEQAKQQPADSVGNPPLHQPEPEDSWNHADFIDYSAGVHGVLLGGFYGLG
jgi:hypothetical protein